MVLLTTETTQAGIPSELRSLAPNMPEFLGVLTRYGIFAVTASEDGSSCKVCRLQKIDQVDGAYRITDEIEVSAADALTADAWITRASQNLNGKVTPRQLHQLGVVGDVLKGVLREIKPTDTPLPFKPAV